MIAYIIYFAIFAVIYLSGLKYTGKSLEQPFNRYNTNCLRGFAAMLVLFYHMGRCMYFGPIAVGLFFMLSAYGLVKSYQRYGQKYLKKMLFSNIPMLYGEFVIINAIDYLAIKSSQESVWWQGLLKIFGVNGFLPYNRVNEQSWYIYTILIVYVAFILIYYLCAKLKAKSFAPFILSALVIGYYILCNGVSSISVLYGRAILCFIIGLFYGTFTEQITNILRKYFWQFGILMIAVLGYCLFKREELIISVGVSIFVLLVFQKFNFVNKFYAFLGYISLEIYLLQYLFLKSFESLIDNSFLFMFLVIICTLTAAIALRLIKSALIALVKHIKTKRCKQKSQPTGAVN